MNKVLAGLFGLIFTVMLLAPLALALALDEALDGHDDDIDWV